MDRASGADDRLNEIVQKTLDVLAPAVLNPLYRALRGDRGARYRAEVERLNASSLDDIRAFQLRRLRVLCADAAAHTVFYAERFRTAGISRPDEITWDEYAHLPPLTRADLRDRGSELLRRGADPARLRPTATGGTTTAPVPLLMDWDAVNRRQSATEAFDRWYGHRPGLRIAYLWGAPRDFAHVSWRTRMEAAWFKRFRFFPSTLLDEEVLDRYERELRVFRPALLQAYPTPLAIFAEHLLARGRQLPLRAVACTAEPLLPGQRELIERAFGTRPFEWYGAREAGRIASECRAHHGLHVNSYGLVVEVGPAPGLAGGGPLLITDLWNTAMPVLRYEIGDLGTLVDTPCSCGSSLPRIMEVMGRIVDVFVNSRGQQVPGAAFAPTILTECRGIRGIQIVQRDIAKFEILVVPGTDYGEESRSGVVSRLEGLMGEANEVNFRAVEEIPREPSGKLRFCINAMGEERR